MFLQAKFLVVNFPHNPSTATVTPEFYVRLVVTLAKEKRFYIISDIAYADITFDGYKTPSIMEVDGAKDVAVEAYTLSKSYNMAGWRVGFIVGNKKLIGALTEYQIMVGLRYVHTCSSRCDSSTWMNMDIFQMKQIIPRYKKRRDVMIDAFTNAGWPLAKPNASMFIWGKIPEIARDMGSLEFSKTASSWKLVLQ